MLPWLIGAAVVAGAAAIASSKSECRWCSNEVYKNGLCYDCYMEELEERRREQEEEARRRERERKKESIRNEIREFEKRAIEDMKNRYGIELYFNSKDVSYKEDGEIKALKDKIKSLEEENLIIEETIIQLQRGLDEARTY